MFTYWILSPQHQYPGELLFIIYDNDHAFSCSHLWSLFTFDTIPAWWSDLHKFVLASASIFRKSFTYSFKCFLSLILIFSSPITYNKPLDIMPHLLCAPFCVLFYIQSFFLFPSFSLFLTSLTFEFRALCLLGTWSATWVMP